MPTETSTSTWDTFIRFLNSVRADSDLLGDRQETTKPSGRAIPELTDTINLQELGRECANFFLEHVRESFTVEPGAAVREHDEQNPGKYKILFKTRDGQETLYRGLVSHVPATESTPQGAVARPLDLVRNREAPVGDRLTALQVLLHSDYENELAAIVVDELNQENLDSEWRDALVFVAEDIHFPEPTRAVVSERLFNIAADLRIQASGREKVVWSALRRAASLISPDRIQLLMPFLDVPISVDTRAVALQCVERVFELAPPLAVDSSLANRIASFASKVLDPLVFTAGELSLVGRNAVVALGAIGDPRLLDSVSSVLSLAHPWLTRRVRDELARLRDTWRENNVPPDHPALANLCAALDRLV